MQRTGLSSLGCEIHEIRPNVTRVRRSRRRVRPPTDFSRGSRALGDRSTDFYKRENYVKKPGLSNRAARVADSENGKRSRKGAGRDPGYGKSRSPRVDPDESLGSSSRAKIGRSSTDWGSTNDKMPNESAPICGCGVVLDLPKSRNGMTAISTKNLTILIPKTSKQSKSEVRGGKKQTEEEDAPKPQTPDTGSTSSVTEQRRPGKHTSKQKKRLNSSRRTRSAERSDSHYTYIDSGSSVVSGNGIRENTIPEAVYSTVQESPNRNVNGMSSSQVNGHSRPQPVYKIPSMTSPPPTYDVAMWQSGLPPSYEEYLCHKYAVITRSHTPPPPWSDSTPSIQQTRRDLLASQPELREFLTHLRQRAQHINNQPTHPQQQQQQQQQGVLRDTTCLSNQQALRKQTARTQRPRAPPVRSQSESRAQQQRITTMYEDSAFCMETTVIQSVFDNGISFCSVM